MRTGRPTKYRPEMCDEVVPFMAEGYSKEALAGHFGINQDTLYEWIKRYPDFSEAVKNGVEASRHMWETLGMTGAKGSDAFNATAWIFNMKNRFGWKDKQEVTGEGGAPFKIVINPNADDKSTE